jgi:hypothetical protein
MVKSGTSTIHKDGRSFHQQRNRLSAFVFYRRPTESPRRNVAYETPKRLGSMNKQAHEACREVFRMPRPDKLEWELLHY